MYSIHIDYTHYDINGDTGTQYNSEFGNGVILPVIPDMYNRLSGRPNTRYVLSDVSLTVRQPYSMVLV